MLALESSLVCRDGSRLLESTVELGVVVTEHVQVFQLSAMEAPSRQDLENTLAGVVSLPEMWMPNHI